MQQVSHPLGCPHLISRHLVPALANRLPIQLTDYALGVDRYQLNYLGFYYPDGKTRLNSELMMSPQPSLGCCEQGSEKQGKEASASLPLSETPSGFPCPFIVPV